MPRRISRRTTTPSSTCSRCAAPASHPDLLRLALPPHILTTRFSLEKSQEDDDFEEFEQQEWSPTEQDVQDPTMWQDGWEDDEDDADFTGLLRKELDATEKA